MTLVIDAPAPPAERLHYYPTVDSPIGPIVLTSDGTALTGLYLSEQRHAPAAAPAEPAGSLHGAAQWGVESADADPFPAAREQLAAYFAGRLTRFDLPLAPAGTAFQRRVWAALQTIPYGTTLSYGALAREVGNPGAARAVGLANGRNPIALIVPCHRVIGADGSLTGYGGGLPRKAALLAFESRVRGHGPAPFADLA